MLILYSSTCILLIAQATFTLVTSADNSCNPPWASVGQSCYYYEHHRHTWDDARTNCQTKGGALAEIEDEEEDRLVTSTFNVGKHNTWIGGTDRDKAGQWLWTSGKPIKIRNLWYEGRPDNWDEAEHCLAISGHKEWDDFVCERNFRSLCEKNDKQKPQPPPVVTTTPLPPPPVVTTTPPPPPPVVTTTPPPPPPVVTTTPPPPPPVKEKKCIEPWVKYGESCYLQSKELTTWDVALKNCKQMGSSLVEIENKEEANFIKKLTAGSKNVIWLGATDRTNKGTWLWDSGKGISGYVPWHEGAPNNWKKNKDCTTPWYKSDTSCYFFEVNQNSWDDAQTNCKSKGGFLAEIEDENEDSLVQTFYKLNEHIVWLGGSDNDKEGHWRWTSGNPVLMDRLWSAIQPDNWNDFQHCLVRVNGYGWDDRLCTRNYASLCEKRLNVAGENCLGIVHGSQWNDFICVLNNEYVCEKRL